ncbi:MAG TPA: hypothetical protein VD907_01590 [Verrucomicrobiae bacterium]|nr:hypothetical protein [Verrucomicrobiae bacterium]
MNIKKVLKWTAIGFGLFMLITQPEESAAAVGTVLSWLRLGAESIITFVGELFA